VIKDVCFDDTMLSTNRHGPTTFNAILLSNNRNPRAGSCNAEPARELTAKPPDGTHAHPFPGGILSGYTQMPASVVVTHR